MVFSRILIANRGEIAVRVSRGINELGMQSVAIYSAEDRLSLHCVKVNEAYQVGEGKGPVEAYLDIDDILRIAVENKCDAIHPGYGFLSENPDFAEACAARNLTFIGPRPEVMRQLGDKVRARQTAIAAGVPVVPASDPLSDDPTEILAQADSLGLPLMLKASWGGGGRGMRIIRDRAQIVETVQVAKTEAYSFFGNGEVYFEKLIEDARHLEVQILGDNHGNVVHLYERDCSLQRRHQKVLERAPAPNLDAATRNELCQAAVRLAKHAGVNNAATVEFLMDSMTGAFHFIEVNPRIQVEHTVTEEITGIDIVKAQILIAAGAAIGSGHSALPPQEDIKIHGAAMQCRVTTEDPNNNFIPDYGRILAYRSPSGPGIRLDGATAYAGAEITRFYDSLLVKVTTRGHSTEEARDRMHRALLEFRIRGVETNLPFLQELISHRSFLEGTYNTRFIDENASLFEFPERRDRATRLLAFIGDVIVNGNSQTKDRPKPDAKREPKCPPNKTLHTHTNLKAMLEKEGPEAVAAHLKASPRPLVTDTTMRDAHQSLLATRMRTRDILRIAPIYSAYLPQLFSVESWGGATFDVALRFLKEDPWQRLADLSRAMPNIMQQMLLRGSNAVGYTNYPDNVVKFFIEQAADAGVDIFRIFDSLNWSENMKLAIETVAASGKIAEAAICYTGNMLDPNETRFTVGYYVELAKDLEKAGAHILGIKDMAGLLRPAAARELIAALKNEIDLPIHLHTHDISGLSAATILAAVDAGVDAFDAAMDSMSGLTSQPCLGSLVATLDDTDQSTGLDVESVRQISAYWEDVRRLYSAFEPSIRSGTSDIYLHEMPGGQYTNLKEQARAMGLESRWDKIAQTYADVNDMFGNIVKVTPSSKVVGDMALSMVSAGLTRAEVEDPQTEISFPDSVVALFRGDLGQPPNPFPTALQEKVLGGQVPLTERPGSTLPDEDLEKVRQTISDVNGYASDRDLASALMYPEIFRQFSDHRSTYGDTSILPTSVFFYGMKPGEEIVVNLEPGRQVIIRYLACSEADPDGRRRLFFELNGQGRSVWIKDKALGIEDVVHEKADPQNPNHIGAQMPGLVASITVREGETVLKGQSLLVLEAMKMQSEVRAERDAKIKRLVTEEGQVVETKDLLIETE